MSLCGFGNCIQQRIQRDKDLFDLSLIYIVIMDSGRNYDRLVKPLAENTGPPVRNRAVSVGREFMCDQILSGPFDRDGSDMWPLTSCYKHIYTFTGIVNDYLNRGPKNLKRIILFYHI